MHDLQKISRRKLIGYSLPVIGSLLMPGFISCKKKDGKSSKFKTTKSQSPQQRDWSKDELYLHAQTKAVHYPALFKNYKIPPDKYITRHQVSNWEQLLSQQGVHFTKDQSALIFERLALRELKPGFNDATLNKSLSVMARSFSPDYAVQNKYNWRGHDLMLQLIALNDTKAAAEKFGYYKQLIAAVDFNSIKKIPKRNQWLKSEAEFNKRVQYILSNKEQFQQKLTARIL